MMRNDLYGIGVFILVIWLVFIVDTVIPASLIGWGLQPRTVGGLIGIPLMPFLHDGLGHLLSNTMPLIVLLVLLLSSPTGNGWGVVVAVALINGVLLWLFGRSSIHVGASGLVFGLIAFLIVSGVMEKRLVPLAISILVGLLFGGTLVSGVIPRMGSYVSWDGHLAGATAGALVAYTMTTYQKSARAFR